MYLLFSFETVFYSVAQVGLELMATFTPQLPDTGILA